MFISNSPNKHFSRELIIKLAGKMKVFSKLVDLKYLNIPPIDHSKRQFRDDKIRWGTVTHQVLRTLNCLISHKNVLLYFERKYEIIFQELMNKVSSSPESLHTPNPFCCYKNVKNIDLCIDKHNCYEVLVLTSRLNSSW